MDPRGHRATRAPAADQGGGLRDGADAGGKRAAKRLRKRIEDPERHWKFDAADLVARAQWAEYRAAYAEAFARCSDPAPWLIVPADRKWFRDVVVATAMVEALEALPLRWPPSRIDVAAFDGLV